MSGNSFETDVEKSVNFGFEIKWDTGEAVAMASVCCCMVINC